MPQPEEPLITLCEFKEEMRKLNEWAQHGCTNGDCQIEKRTGMVTNGSCVCSPNAFAEHLLYLACRLDKHGNRNIRWPKESKSCPPQQ
jgi:hypothetical protein